MTPELSSSLRSRVVMLTAILSLTAGQAAEAGMVPPNFQVTTIFSGLTQPDGRVFVAEKSD
jgi:hypothetical protein